MVNPFANPRNLRQAVPDPVREAAIRAAMAASKPIAAVAERGVIPHQSQIISALPNVPEGKGKEFLLNLLAGPSGIARNAQLLNFDQFLKKEGGVSPQGLLRSGSTLAKPFVPSPFDPFVSELSSRGVLPTLGPEAGPIEGVRARERYRRSGDPKDLEAYWEFASGAAPGTVKRARVDEAREIAEQGAQRIPGSFVQADPRKLSAREIELIEQKEYPLPKHWRGAIEEAPWFAIPEARVMRSTLGATRTGLAKSGTKKFALPSKSTPSVPAPGATVEYSGAFGKFTPVVQAGLRTAEAALKPLELAERATAGVIKAPFTAGQAVVRRVGDIAKRKQIASKIETDIARANEDLDAMDLSPVERQKQADDAATAFNKVMMEDLDISSQMVGKSKYIDPETGGELPNIAVAEDGIVKATPIPKDAPILPEQIAKVKRDEQLGLKLKNLQEGNTSGFSKDELDYILNPKNADEVERITKLGDKMLEAERQMSPKAIREASDPVISKEVEAPSVKGYNEMAIKAYNIDQGNAVELDKLDLDYFKERDFKKLVDEGRELMGGRVPDQLVDDMLTMAETYKPNAQAITSGKVILSKKDLFDNIDSIYYRNPDALPQARDQYVRDYGDQIGKDIDERIAQLTPAPASLKLSPKQVDELLSRVGEPTLAKAAGLNEADRKAILKQVDKDVLNQYYDIEKELTPLDAIVDFDKLGDPSVDESVLDALVDFDNQAFQDKFSASNVSPILKWAQAIKISDKIKDKSLLRSASLKADEMLKSGVPEEQIPHELKWAKEFHKKSVESSRSKNQNKTTFVADTDAAVSEAFHLANSDLPRNPTSHLMNRKDSLITDPSGGDLNKILDDSPSIRGLKIIEDLTNDPQFKHVSTEELMSRISDDKGSPMADWYVRFKHRMWDGTAAIRILQDNYFRSIDPGAAFRLGSKRDVVSGVMLTHGQVGAALGHFDKFMTTKILPVIDEGQSTMYKLNRYLQAKNWQNIVDNGIREAKDFPDYINEVGEKTSSEGWQNWINDMQRELSPEDFRKIEVAAENVRLEYQRFRTELLEHEIITQEFHDELRDAWEWYLPNTYIEYLNTEKIPSKAIGNMSDGIRALSRDPDALKIGMDDELLTAKDPLGDTLPRSYIHHKLRLHRNGLAKAFVDMAKEMQIGLVPAKQSLYGKTKKYIEQPDGTLEKVIDNEDLYDDKLKSGFITFVENGERQIYGQLKEDGSVGPINKLWWDGLNGRAGLNSMSGHGAERFLRDLSQFYRHNLTTYDPLFFASNGIIDSVGIMLRYRVMPTSVANRIIDRVRGMNNEKRVREIMEASGAYTSSITGQDYRLISSDKAYANINNKRIFDAIERENKKNNNQSVHILDSRNQAGLKKALDDATETFYDYKKGRMMPKKNFTAKVGESAPLRYLAKVGETIEQAPRQLAFEKTLKKLIGNKKMWGNDEWKRLMNLDDDEWYDELYGVSKNVVRNVRNSKTEISLAEAVKINPNTKIGSTVNTKGLIDRPEVQQAAINAMESTINFNRGGMWIKKLNPYFLFLNASAEGGKWIFRSLGVHLDPSVTPVINPKPGEPAFRFGDTFRQGDEIVRRKGVLGTSYRPSGRGVTAQYEEALGDFMGIKVPGGQRAAAAYTFALATFVDQSVMAWNMQFAEYQDVPDEVKYGAFMIMLPPKKDENGEVIINQATRRPYPNYIAVPHRLRNLAVWFAPQRYLHMKLAEEWDDTFLGMSGYNPPAEAPTEFGQLGIPSLGGIIPKSWGGGRSGNGMLDVVFKEMSPVSGIHSVVPYLLKMPVELSLNKNLYFDEPIVDPTYADAEPEEQFHKYTTESARLTSEILGDKAGWLPDSFRSASKIDYVRGGVLPITNRVMGYADWVAMLMLDSRKKERQIWEEKIKDFKLMPKLEQDEYKASLSKEDRDKFDKAMRSKPLSDENHLKAIWENSGVPKRFSGSRTGATSETQRRASEKAIKEVYDIEVDKTEGKRFYAEHEKYRIRSFYDQQEDDKELSMGQITPDEWNDRRKDRTATSQGYYEAMQDRFPKSIQAQEDEVKELWFDNYYTASGTIEDTREPYMHWISAIHKIKTPEEDPSKTWTQYFSERDDLKKEAVKYLMENPVLQPNGTPFPDQAERFYRQLEASWTEGQKSWYRTNEILSQEVTVMWGGRNIKASYWDAGKDLQVLYPSHRLNQKVIAAWKAYVETGTDRTAKNTRDDLKKDFPFLRDAVKRRAKLRDQVIRSYNVKYGGPLVEHLLVYWYGTILSEEGQRYKDAKRQLGQTRIPQVPIKR